MTAERDSMTLNEISYSALGVEERSDADYIVDPMDDIRRVLYGRSRPVAAGVRAVGVLQLHQSALVHSPRLYGFWNIPADRQRTLVRSPLATGFSIQARFLARSI